MEWRYEAEGRGTRLIALAVFVLLFAGVLAGCSGGSAATSSSESSGSESGQVAQEQAAYIGTWDMQNAVLKGKNVTSSQLDQMRKEGYEFFVNIADDGTWLLCFGDDSSVAEGTWSATTDGNLMLTSSDGAAYPFVIDGETATMNTVKLTKSSEPKTAPAHKEKSSSSAASESSASSSDESSASESGEVSADVKEALDSYEAVMDEYVSFMQKYKDSGYSADMLSDYTAMLQKYTEFSEKINAMDTSNMSSADYAYYIEVTGRVSQKLMDVAL